MTALIVFLVLVAAILLALVKGRDSRVVDERGWWPAYRDDARGR
jgi:hypothetical protein